ncbi:MAG: FkbM family methyltransferase [Chitinophagaceae bacterium]
MKKIFNGLLYRLGYRLQPINTPLQNAFKAQEYLMGSSPLTIFDIGAHFGETSLFYNKIFSYPTIYSFEPFLPSFEILKSSVKSFHNIKVFNLAISSFSGQVDFNVNKSSATNSILPTSKDGGKNWGENLLDTIETIKLDSITIDDFVEKCNIENIDILKIDTQGTEYEIIQGASKSIEQNKIKLIYLEIIIVSTYQGQKYFDEILLLLRTKGFQLFNIYNCTYSDKNELKQLDAIFINKTFNLL